MRGIFQDLRNGKNRPFGFESFTDLTNKYYTHLMRLADILTRLTGFGSVSFEDLARDDVNERFKEAVWKLVENEQHSVSMKELLFVVRMSGEFVEEKRILNAFLSISR